MEASKPASPTEALAVALAAPRARTTAFRRDAPYGPFFLLGASSAIVAALLWFLALEARRVGLALGGAPSIAPARVHAVLLLFGVLTDFAFGFLLTAFPRWTEATPLRSTRVRLLFAVRALGEASLLPGLLGRDMLVLPGMAFLGVALAALVAALAPRATRAPRGRRSQPAIVVAGLTGGFLGLALCGAGLLRDSPATYQAGIACGFFGYLFVLVAAVGGRVIPFFTALALSRPAPPARRSPLAWIALVAAVRVACAMGGPPFARAALVADAVLAALLARELVALAPGRALREPLIAVLYLGQVWAILAFGASALRLLAPGSPPPLDLPVLHALGIGGFATLVLGIATRVALGHSGRPMTADRPILAAFVAIQLAAVARVALCFPWPGFPTAPLFAHWAALPWCAAFALWLVRLAPLLAGARVRE